MKQDKNSKNTMLDKNAALPKSVSLWLEVKNPKLNPDCRHLCFVQESGLLVL